MKKVFYLVVASLMFTGLTLSAQENKQVKEKRTPEERANKRVERIVKTVGDVTDEQQKELYNVFVENEKERDIRQAEGRKKRSERLMQRNEHQEHVKSILGEEKYNKYKDACELKQENRKNRKELKGERRGNGKGKRANQKAPAKAK